MCYVTARSGQKPSEKGKRNRVTSPAVDYELPDELEGRLCLKDGMWGNRKQPITMCEDSREENCRETLLRINMARIAPSGSSHTHKKNRARMCAVFESSEGSVVTCEKVWGFFSWSYPRKNWESAYVQKMRTIDRNRCQSIVRKTSTTVTQCCLLRLCWTLVETRKQEEAALKQMAEEMLKRSVWTLL